MDTLAFGYVIPAIRAYSGLAPVRQCSCRAYYQFDKHIARRYDGMSGGRYYITICSQYYDGVLTDEDIREFGDEIYNKLKEDKEFFLKR